MSTNPVLVRNITHLTDARYFAAMEVDWISIRLSADPASFLLWHTLHEWVSGVKLAAELPADDEALLARALIEAQPDGVVFSSPVQMDIPDDIHLFFEAGSPGSHGGSASPWSWILPYPANADILSAPDPRKYFLAAEWTTVLLKEVLASGYAGGICFSGGEEEATGMRDYEWIDEMMEILRASEK